MSDMTASLGHGIWAYPWDLLEGDLKRNLVEIREAGLQSVSVATVYHAARLLAPHNPHRKVFNVDDAVYFRPELSYYASALTPRMSEDYAARDPLTEICEAAEKQGLRVLAWTVFLHNSRLGEMSPDATVRNAFGDRYIHALCPAAPEVRDYALGLGKDIASHYPVAALDIEALGYMGYPHSSHHDKAAIDLPPLHTYLLSVCFCPHCSRHMEESGIDARAVADTFRRELTAWFEGNPAMSGLDEVEGLVRLIGRETASRLLSLREKVVASLLADLREAVPATVHLLIRTSQSPFHVGGKTPLDATTVGEYAEGVVFSFFTMPRSQFDSELAAVPWTRVNGKPVWSGLSVGLGTPGCRDEQEFHDRMSALRLSGFRSHFFFNYGLMPRRCLGWIRSAIG